MSIIASIRGVGRLGEALAHANHATDALEVNVQAAALVISCSTSTRLLAAVAGIDAIITAHSGTLREGAKNCGYRLLGGKILRHSGDLIIGQAGSDALHDRVFAQQSVEVL